MIRHFKIDEILNLLPTHFWEKQDEASRLIRLTAKKAYEVYGDIDETKRILELSKRFKFRSAAEAEIIEGNFKQIQDISGDERKYEAKLTCRNEDWQILKEGVRSGKIIVKAADVSSIRWGTMISRQQSGALKHEYLMVIGVVDGQQITFDWTATDIETGDKLFSNLIDGAFAYLFSSIVEKIEKKLGAGEMVRIGPCRITNSGVAFDTQGWLFSNTREVPWSLVQLDLKNGDLTVYDRTTPKAKVTMSFRDTANAPILRALATLRQTPEDK